MCSDWLYSFIAGSCITAYMATFWISSAYSGHADPLGVLHVFCRRNRRLKWLARSAYDPYLDVLESAMNRRRDAVRLSKSGMPANL